MSTVEDVLQHAARVPGRLALGSTMAYHGLSKLRGEGPRQTAQFFENIGIRPGKPWALATGWAELLSGAALLLGIATRPAAIGVLVTQSVAIAKVHAPRGFSVEKQGAEFNLALCALALGTLLRGPGRYSVHGLVHRRVRRRRRRTPDRLTAMLA